MLEVIIYDCNNISLLFNLLSYPTENVVFYENGEYFEQFFGKKNRKQVSLYKTAKMWNILLRLVFRGGVARIAHNENSIDCPTRSCLSSHRVE